MHRNAERDQIRHPGERLILLLSALANLAIVAAVVAALLLAPDWLKAHPRVQAVAQRVRGAVVLAVVVLPALSFLRRGRLALVRENSVRLRRDHVPRVFTPPRRRRRAPGSSRLPAPA